MPRTKRTQWKFAEDRLARFFGTVRRPLSGGGSKTGRDDGMHPRLFLSSKYGKCLPLFRLYREEREKAKKEGKTPVIALQEHSAKGMLLVIHSSDFEAVIAEYLSGGSNWKPEPIQSPPKKPIRRLA